MYIAYALLNPRARTTRDMLADFSVAHGVIEKCLPPADSNRRLLWRLTPGRDAVTVLVVSQHKPTLDYLTDEAGWTIAPAETTTFDPTTFTTGNRLEVTLTARCARKVTGEDGRSRRLDLRRDEERLDWLGRKGTQHGFRVMSAGVTGCRDVPVRRNGRKWGLRLVDFRATIEITNVDTFAETLVTGIGPAKLFGAGLLGITRSLPHEQAA